ncbi:MAG: HD domain-containing protein [Atopobiaceae bacterium]
MHIDRTRALQAFKSYVSAYDPTNPRIALKVSHTYRVADLCDDIARSLQLTDDQVDLAWLCGLLHDIGRFEQVRRYDTFLDSKSVSHALLGAQVLFEDATGPAGDIRRFVQDDSADDAIHSAVAYHSALALPDGLDAQTRRLCDIVRDADKIDILKVNHDSPVDDIYPFGQKDLSASDVSPQVVEAFLQHRTVPHAIRRYPADMVLGHVCFVWGLVYPRSLELAVRQGYVFDMLERDFTNEQTQRTFRQLDRHLRDWLRQEGLA